MIEPQHRRSTKGLSLGLVALTLARGVRAMADDWPQFLGPTRTGVYNGPALSETWGPTGPRLVWRRHVGQGLSGPVVAQNRVILHLWTAI